MTLSETVFAVNREGKGGDGEFVATSGLDYRLNKCIQYYSDYRYARSHIRAIHPIFEVQEYESRDIAE